MTEKFIEKVRRLLKERGETFNSMEEEIGVAKHTLYRGVKTRSTVAAIAYYLQMDAHELTEGTDIEEIWDRRFL